MFLTLILIVAVSLYRLVLPSENFAPLSAIAICGGMYLSRRMSLMVVVGLMLVSDFWVNLVKYQGAYGLFPPEVLGHYAGFLVALMLGWWIRPRKKLWTVAGGTVAASVLFFAFSNFVSWLVDAYPKNLGGLWQCFTVGLPGYPSTIAFFLRTLASDVIFTGLFVAVSELAARELPDTRFKWLLAEV